MKTTIGEFVSRIRREIKAVRQDSNLSDRFLFSLIVKHGNWLLKREDSANKLLRFDSIIEVLPLVDLIEVDKVEAGCRGIYSQCTFKRTKDPLPAIFDGYSGPLIRAVTSIDGSEELQPTDPSIYINITKQSSYRYNRSKYYWYLHDHLYFPQLQWDAVRIEAVFSGDTSAYSCNDCAGCIPRQEQPFNIPVYLHGELESHVIKDLHSMMNIPPDPVQDKQSLTR